MLLALILCSAGWLRANAAETKPPAPVRVLFVGNSFTFAGGGLWNMFRELSKAGGHPVEVAKVCYPAKTLQWHWEQGEVLDMVEESDWDYVVLQPWSWGSLESDLNTYVPKFAEAIRRESPKTKIVLYMHGYKNDMGDKIQAEYQAAANKAGGAIIMPAARAWGRALKEKPKDPWYYTDGWHPGANMIYLTSCTLYATIFEQSPEGIPCFWGIRDRELGAYMQKLGWETARDFSTAPGLLRRRQAEEKKPPAREGTNAPAATGNPPPAKPGG
jgi:hypothetical protein